MATEMKDTFDNFFKQATETVQNSVNTSVRWTEEMSKFWTRPVGAGQSFEDARRKGEQFVTDVIGLLQKNTAESQKCVDAQCRNGMDLTRKTFETIGTDDVTDLRDKSMNLWTTTFDAARKSTEIGMNAGMQMLENWTSFVTRSFNASEMKKAAAK